jgi:TRAP-type uncharacterized transport system fused permease subunit
MLSAITPPVAIASFAAAGIANSPPMQTGWESMRIGSIIYFIPFFFVLNPAFVLQSTAMETLVVTGTAIVGVTFVCAGLQGYQLFIGNLARAGRLELPLRALLILGGLALVAPGGGVLAIGHGQLLAVAAALLLPALFVAWRLTAQRGTGAAPAPLAAAEPPIDPKAAAD